MSSSRKKIIVRKFSREWLAGYIAAANFVVEGAVEVLDLSGKVIKIPLGEVKWLCFVRDFNSGEVDNPERLLRKTFAGRPRTEGLGLRLGLKDDDRIEGMASNDISLLNPWGIFLTPPDIRSNTQRVFVPRTSIVELEVVAMISAPVRRKTSTVGDSVTPRQEDLFS